jgi:predicted anti-sigma-YlaC factor YlaD
VKKLSCQEVLDQLADYLDADAQAELVAQVDLHVGSCEHCRVEVDTLKRTIMIYRCNEQIVLPLDLDERLRVALKQVYRESGLPGDPADSGEGEA